MKYLPVLIISIIAFNCSPRVAPDAGWGYQRWALVEMKGVPVQQSGTRRDAFIRFDVNEKRFNGNGGCNQVNGNYNVEKKSIHFMDVISTKMSCNDIDFENTFLSTLNTVDHYEIRGSDLALKRKSTTVLVLRPTTLDR